MNDRQTDGRATGLYQVINSWLASHESAKMHSINGNGLEPCTELSKNELRPTCFVHTITITVYSMRLWRPRR